MWWKYNMLFVVVDAIKVVQECKGATKLDIANITITAVIGRGDVRVIKVSEMVSLREGLLLTADAVVVVISTRKSNQIEMRMCIMVMTYHFLVSQEE
jgi:hypothetical protein